jgi:FkbM family methyltransferase
VLDRGANFGQFARQVTARFGCECLAVEPSPEPFAHIPAGDRIRKFNVAIAPRPGEVAFHVSPHPTASSLLHEDAAHQRTISMKADTLAGFIRRLGWDGINLLKMAIEGPEIEILRTTSDGSLRKVG